MPSSLHARITRSAISPRFAIKIFSNIFVWRAGWRSYRALALASTEAIQHLSELHRLAIFGDDFRDYACRFGFNLVHHFHRFDNANDRVFGDFLSNVHEWRCIGGGPAIKRADHWRNNIAQRYRFRRTWRRLGSTPARRCTG